MRINEEEYKSGLTRYSILAIIYAIAIFVPSSIYLSLMLGSGSVGSSFFTLLLFVELGRLAGIKITKQEAAIILMFAGGMEFNLMQLIYRSWFVKSDIARMFGISHKIPWWYAPSAYSNAYEMRSLLHPDFFAPMMIIVILSFIGIFVSWGWSMLAKEIFIEEENLPYPMADMTAKLILTMTEEREDFSLKILGVSALVGLAYGFITYVWPFFLTITAGIPYERAVVIPLPWFDLTRYFGIYLPGAVLGIATDISAYLIGFILPFHYILQIVIISFLIFVVGNWLSVILFPPYGYKDWWFPNLSAQSLAQRSVLYIWASLTIGFSLSVGLIPLISRPDVLKKLFKKIVSLHSKIEERRTQPIPGGFLLGSIIPILIGFVTQIFCLLYFVPEWVLSNPWVLVFFPSVMFLSALARHRMVGETGISVDVSNVTNMIYYLTDAPVPVWFTPLPGFSSIALSGTPFDSWIGSTHEIKIAEITKTKFSSLLRTTLIFAPISIMLSLLFTQVFWSIAPIPSGRYPGAAIYWPIRATYSCIWIAGRETGFFNVNHVFVGAIAALFIQSISFLTKIPISIAALASGMSTLPPYAIAYLISGFLASFLKRFLGTLFWEKYRRIIAAGVSLGLGVMIAVGVSLMLIDASISGLPW